MRFGKQRINQETLRKKMNLYFLSLKKYVPRRQKIVAYLPSISSDAEIHCDASPFSLNSALSQRALESN